MGAGAAMLATALLVGILGNIAFGEQEGGGANVLHLVQLALLALGGLTLVTGAVVHVWATRRRTA
jgi:hypothetical protein